MAPALTVAVLSLAISVLIAAVIFSNSRKRTSSRLPPGSKGWPLVGEGLSFLKPHPSTTLGDFMERRISRYGKIFSTNLFGKPVIISTDIELNRFIVQNDTKLFTHGWPQHFVDLIGESALLFTMGDTHKFRRSIFLSFFRSARLESFLQGVEQVAAMAMSSWDDNSVVCAKDEARKFIFNTIAKKTMSMAPGEPRTEMLQREFDTLTKGVLSIPLKLPGTTYWKALQARASLSKVIKQNIEERIQKKGIRHTEPEDDDFLGWIMENTSHTLEETLGLLRNAIIGNYLTTSIVITTAMYFLGKFPKARKQLREEHLEIVRRGGSELTWEDYKHMEFTQCVINETLRFGSGGILQKKALADIEFKGFVIPRGHIVMANISAMHLDPSLHEDPEHFNPWRWLGGTSAKKSNLMPFGGGIRLCPGSELARLEINVFLHHLILNYDWNLVSAEYPVARPNLEFPNGLPIKVQALSLGSPFR